MKWTDAMRDNASVPSRYRAVTDAGVVRSSDSTSWDPYEVWLTRVKQPRDHAARLLMGDAVPRARKLPE